MSEDDQGARDALRYANDSGFPLQIAAAHAACDQQLQDRWSVTQVEHYWRHPSRHDEGYIDLIMRDRHDLFCLVCECKRSRDSAWVFMAEKGWPPMRTPSRLLVARAPRVNNPAIPRKRGNVWLEVPNLPEMPEAMFCAVRGQKSGDARIGTLERIASELVASTEALAESELALCSYEHHVRAYVGVIITTAELYVTGFDPSAVDLASGEIGSEVEVRSTPMLKFRKQLIASRRAYGAHDAERDWRELAAEQEQTVYVVNSRAWPEFLRIFDQTGQASARLFATFQ